MRSSAVIAALLLLVATSAMAQNVVAPSGSIGGVGSLKLGSVSINQPVNPITVGAAAPGDCPIGPPQQFEIADTTAGPLCLQIPFSALSGTATNSQLAGPLVNGVTIGAGGDFTLSKTDPLAVGNETLTPGNVTATHLSSPLPVAQGGTGASTLTAHGVLLGEGTSAVAPTGTQTAGQVLVGQGATLDPLWKSGSACAANQFINSSLFSSAGVLPCAQPSFANLSGNPTGAQLGITITSLKGSGAGTYSTTSVSFVKVDAANLQQTVNPIPSGTKLVWTVTDVEGFNNTAGDGCFFAIFDGSTQIGTTVINGGTANQTYPVTLGTVVTGDGASHTLALEWKVISGGTCNIANATATNELPQIMSQLTPSN